MKLSERIGVQRRVFSGKAGERVLTVRLVEEGDADAVIALQKHIIDCMPDKSLLVGVSREEVLDAVRDDLSLGIFDGDVPVAFSQMILNHDSPHNLGQKLGYDPNKCVYYDIAFVHPDYRGLGLQAYMIALRDEIARELGAQLAFVTVSPDNAHSLKNVMGSGFEVLERRTMYGGRDRYILMKRF